MSHERTPPEEVEPICKCEGVGIFGGKICCDCDGDFGRVTWKQFTKRTNDPKLAWLERRLTEAGIPNTRAGVPSFHAPILRVANTKLDDAWEILDPVDEIEDDDPRWLEDGERLSGVAENQTEQEGGGV
jgi:hypothetical protein